jgi:hypothetical protein
MKGLITSMTDYPSGQPIQHTNLVKGEIYTTKYGLIQYLQSTSKGFTYKATSYTNPHSPRTLPRDTVFLPALIPHQSYTIGNNLVVTFDGTIYQSNQTLFVFSNPTYYQEYTFDELFSIFS